MLHALLWSTIVGLKDTVVVGQALRANIQPNLVLWLDADVGVDVTPGSKRVLRWRDQSGGNYIFTPLSPAQHRAASARWKTAITRTRGRDSNGISQAPGDLLHFIAARKAEGKTAVTFPAPLIANDVQLRDGITAFFVLTPSLLQSGDQAIGQRFFGHYPYGQFRFHNGRLAFKTENGDHVHSSEDVTEGETILAAYRFDGNVQISLNGGPFEISYTSKRKRPQPPIFSASGYISLGGCPPHNSFVGDIAEIMIFGIPLDDSQARHVAEVLAERNGLSITATATYLTPPQPLPQFQTGHSQVKHSPNPSLPELSALIDGTAEAAPERKKSRAIDRVPTYKRIREMGRSESETIQQAPNSDITQTTESVVEGDLLTQLRAAQTKLTQLQDALQRQRQRAYTPRPVFHAEEKGFIHTLQSDAEIKSPIILQGSTSQSIHRDPQVQARNSCVGGDAFEKVSISKWTPPANAHLEQIQQWKEAKAQSDVAIKGYPRGGKELRDFVHKQVESLRLLRHNLFCAFV